MRSFTSASVLILVICLPGTGRAQDPASFYEENCATCHTIGGGVIGGPDLKGVTARRDRDRLIRFLLDPDAFANDPLRMQMIKEADGLAMGKTDGLTRELADKILLFIDQQSVGGGTPPAEKPFAPLTPEEAILGRNIFSGRTPLTAGGPSCVACHSAGDGTTGITAAASPAVRASHAVAAASADGSVARRRAKRRRTGPVVVPNTYPAASA